MTHNEILRRFPKASDAFIRANLSAGDSESPDTKPCQRPVALAGNCERKARGGRCFHVCFTLIRKSLLDVDAKYASTKHLLDCLVATGIVDGDKEGQITLEVVQRKIQKGEPESVVVEVYQ